MPGGAYFSKWIVAVDEDVDPTDINQVLWAMPTRCNPAEDIGILKNPEKHLVDMAGPYPESISRATLRLQGPDQCL